MIRRTMVMVGTSFLLLMAVAICDGMNGLILWHLLEGLTHD